MPSPYNTSNSGNRNIVIGGVVAIVLVMVIAVGWAIQSNRDTTGDDTAAPGEGQSEVDLSGVQMSLTDEYGLGVGDSDAPVKVEIFEDFQCPYCADLEEESKDDLMRAAADGKAFVVYRPMAFLNDYSDEALNAFGVVLDEAGGQAALKFHDLLFANQPSEGGESPDTQWLIDLAAEAGADQPAVAEGIESGSFKQWALNASDDASKRGVNGTPTALVDGEQVGGNTIEEMAGNLADAVG